MHVCSPSTGTGDRDSLLVGVHSAVMLVTSVSSEFIERSCQKGGARSKEDTSRKPLASTCEYMGKGICTHVHTYTLALPKAKIELLYE